MTHRDRIGKTFVGPAPEPDTLPLTEQRELTQRLLHELATKITEHERDRCVGILNQYAAELNQGGAALVHEGARRLRAKP